VSGTASDPFGVFNLSLSIIYFLIQHNIWNTFDIIYLILH
jgi:hypothetical protein